MIIQRLLLFILICGSPAFAQSNNPAPPQAPARVECQPQPDCRVIVSPLRPGAAGVGIRDKALINEGVSRQPATRGFTHDMGLGDH